MIQVQFDKTFESWRERAREYLLQGITPQHLSWGGESLLFSTDLASVRRPLQQAPKVPKEFFELAETVAAARDEDRWSLLYRLLYRLQHEDKNLLQISVDPDVMKAARLSHSVRRDIHKMHAFVRFKHISVEGQDVYVAWHKPEHYSVRLGTPFFVRRFGDRRWSIFTPDESAHWDLKKLSFGPGIEQHEFAVRDDWDEVWKTYYKSIFNPARIKIKMMKSEMSPKYWASMPETALIPELVREAPRRLQTMAANHRLAAQVDSTLSLPELKAAAKSCQACPLFQQATHTVFGVGSPSAKIMIVGEQPGDQEDLAGEPFVGPAGQVLEQALRAAGLSRDEVYVTNAVKHFKWTRHEKMRLHQKPSGQEMHACKPWLEAETAQVKPDIIVALGATAGTAVLGRLPKVGAERGKVITGSNLAPKVILSWHPAAILRTMDENEARERMHQLREDLRLAAAHSL